MIKEVIVVEGKDDETRIKQAVDCQVIITGGSYFNSGVIQEIKQAMDRVGVIVLTDPDYAGNKIREKINRLVPGVKNAYVDQQDAVKKNDIGIENASYESIREALKKAKSQTKNPSSIYKMEDLVRYQLTGKDSKKNRIKIGKLLGIGYHNSKSLLKTLNHYQITEDELREALNE